jgi:hypothetical protein
MYPHERSLVERMKAKPFVLLGVNSDQDRAALKEVVKREQITWRSFWNGGMAGPIPSQYGVRAWPTLFLIDAKGIIRHKWEGAPSARVLDDAIEALLGEVGK